jgi:hypothetical protein
MRSCEVLCAGRARRSEGRIVSGAAIYFLRIGCRPILPFLSPDANSRNSDLRKSGHGPGFHFNNSWKIIVFAFEEAGCERFL